MSQESDETGNPEIERTIGLRQENELLRRRIDRLTALEEATLHLAQSFDSSDLQIHIVEAAVGIANADEAALMLVHDQNAQLYTRVQFSRGESAAVMPNVLSDDVVASTVVNTRMTHRQACPEARTALGGLVAASLYVPLVYRNETFGVLRATKRLPCEPFDDEDERLLCHLADFAVAALSNRKMLDQTPAKTVADELLQLRVDSLQKELEGISYRLRVEEVSERILDELQHLVQFRTAALHLVRDGVRILLAGRGFDPARADEWITPEISMDPLMVRVVKNREPLILSQTAEDPDWRTAYATAQVASWVAVPLAFRDEVIGIITFTHDQPGFYTYELMMPLRGFAGQAAVELHRANEFDLAQRRIVDLELVASIGHTISSTLDTGTLLKALVTAICSGLQCADSTVFLPRQVNGETLLYPEARKNAEPADTSRFRAGEGVAGWVFLHGTSILLQDATKDARYVSREQVCSRRRSLLAVPIKSGEQILGVITADQDSAEGFLGNHVRLVEALALQVGIAVKRNCLLDALRHINSRIVMSQDINVILQDIVQYAIQLTHTTTGVIYILSEDGSSVTASFHPPGFVYPAPRLQLKSSLTNQIIATRRLVQFENLRESPRVHPALRRNFSSMIGVPLIATGRVLGVLYLNDRAPHRFSDTDVSMLQVLASQAAVAVQNAQSYRQTSQSLDRKLTELEALTNFTWGMVSDFGVEQMLDLAYTQIAKLIDVTNARVQFVVFGQSENDISAALVVEKNNDVEIDRVRFGTPECDGTCRVEEDKTESLNPCDAADLSLVHYVAHTKQPLLIMDRVAEEIERLRLPVLLKFGRSDRTIHFLLFVPMMIRERVIGIIGVQGSRQFLAFDDGTLKVLTTLASQVGVAIENLGLFRRISHAYEALKELDKRKSEFLSTVSHELRSPLASIKLCLELVLDGRYGPVTEIQRERFKMALRKTEEEEYLVGNLLDLVRIEAGKATIVLAPEDVAQLLREVSEQFEAQAANKGISLNLRLPSTMLEAPVDRNAFKRIIANLLDNALKFTRDGSVVMTAEIVQDRMRISVADTGIGLPAAQLDRIFERFYQVDSALTRRVGGAGIGLSIVKSYVDLHRGEITVESEEGKGTTFILWLPLVVDETQKEGDDVGPRSSNN